MKEITRINIARTAYDIEPDAKKELGSYVGQLEKYAENKDTLMDYRSEDHRATSRAWC